MAKSRKPRRSKERLRGQDLVEMAMRRYNISGLRSFRSIRSLSNEFRRDPAVVSKAILRAFQEGLVEVQPSDTPVYQRETRLERSLESKYPRLRAVVVNVGDAAGKQGIDEVKLSRRLGQIAGLELFSSQLFRDQDAIGVGNGATLYFLAKAFERLAHVDGEPPEADRPASLSIDRSPTERTPLPVSVDLVAMTGRFHPSDPEGRLKGGFDSDFLVNLLAPCFSDGTPMILNVPLCEVSPGAQRRVAEQHKMALPRLTHALVGLGVLHPGHRLAELKSGGPGSEYRQVVPKLAELLRLVAKYSDPDAGYVPVAEICCNFFLVEPDRLPPAVADQMRAIIGDLEKQLLTISLEVMQGVQTSIIVAGGPQKGLALRHILSSPDWRRSRMLFTDEETAQQILGGTRPSPRTGA